MNLSLEGQLIRFLDLFSQVSGWDSADLSWALSDGFLQPSCTGGQRYRTPGFLPCLVSPLPGARGGGGGSSRGLLALERTDPGCESRSAGS